MSIVEARELAVRAHRDQCDRDGSFHIAHVARVAQTVPSSAPFQRVAWLHDVLEDSDVEIALVRSRLPAAEADALLLLTHEPHTPYEVYIDRILGADGEAGSIARVVKEADMLDNLHRCVTAHDPAIARYGEALAKLWRRDQATT